MAMFGRSAYIIFTKIALESHIRSMRHVKESFIEYVQTIIKVSNEDKLKGKAHRDATGCLDALRN